MDNVSSSLGINLKATIQVFVQFPGIERVRERDRQTDERTDRQRELQETVRSSCRHKFL